MLPNERVGILDIPDISLLSVTTVQDLLRHFGNRLGAAPESIALPITSAGGLSFDSTLGMTNVATRGLPLGQESGGVRDLREAAREAALAGVPIYLTLNPTFPYATVNSFYTIRDQFGAESQKCCIVNEFTREIARTVITEAVELVQNEGVQLKGIVLPIQDLWPLGAEGPRLALTCFCNYCVQAMTDAQPGLQMDTFRQVPSPFNLALKDSGSGISWLPGITEDLTPQQLLELSRERSYLADAAGSDMPRGLTWAAQLLFYVRARNTATSTALREILEAIPPDLTRGVVAERDAWDWSEGLFAAALTNVGVEEIWTTPGGAGVFPESMSVRIYLSSRARYMVDALFEVIQHVDRMTVLDPTGQRIQAEDADLAMTFVKRANTLLQSLTVTRMDTLPITRTGGSFVAPLLTEGDIKDLMTSRGLRIGGDIQALRQLAQIIGAVSPAGGSEP